jgi:hypothetical protein
MRIPPRWVFEIWNKARTACGLPQLRTLPKDCEKLAELEKEVEEMFRNTVNRFANIGYGNEILDSGAEVIIAFAWALYIWDESPITTKRTKFALAGFLEAGGAYIVRAHDLLCGDRLEAGTAEYQAYESAREAIDDWGRDIPRAEEGLRPIKREPVGLSESEKKARRADEILRLQARLKK